MSAPAPASPNCRRKQQESLYAYPYHFTPHIIAGGSVRTFRSMRWGYEYMCCLLHVKELVGENARGHLLDIGCGDGRLISLLSDNKNLVLHGVDVSQQAIAFARAFNPNSEFICGDVETVPGLYDLVTVIEVLEHVPDGDIERFTAALTGRLKPGGRLVICVPSTNKALNPKHERHYTADTLMQALSPARNTLEILSCEYIFNGRNMFYDLWTKITDNRLWFFSIPFIENLFWHYIWHNMRYSDPEHGFHIVATLRKPVEP